MAAYNKIITLKRIKPSEGMHLRIVVRTNNIAQELMDITYEEAIELHKNLDTILYKENCS